MYTSKDTQVKWSGGTATFFAYPNRTPIQFLQEFVRFHFQDLGRQYIILAGIVTTDCWSVFARSRLVLMV